ncbi:MAG: mannosyl-3-phosphoglycerate synthase [Desulfurococcales archaeon]|nr:mannosyl-3-phosphoglycerate synthase [Desulfurococcales archaeon]MEB3789599.1 mannosyl-3-phosphoglycerate synthase [Desulfurococcales archaeon]
MLIEYPHRFERYGAITIHDIVKVLELDSSNYRGFRGIYPVSYDTLEDYAARTAIIVPVKNEDLLTFEGVLRAIPHGSLVIVVSASQRKPVDIYNHEVELVRVIHESTRKGILIVHQHDPTWGEVLRDTQLSDMLGKDGTVRRGKGEGMLLGALIAAGLGYNYIGFIDSDNYVPGSVHEYSWIYYSGFSMSRNPYTMVRIKWSFKGKLASSSMYLRRRGRVSMVTNSVLNYALSVIRRVETDIINTANSGEHALSTELALRLKWAGGFAVEPFQLVYMLENCYLSLEESCDLLPHGVNIYQIEARNPHIHAERGDEHIVDMIAKSLGTIYYSKLNNDKVKARIHKVLKDYGWTKPLPKIRVYDPRGVNAEKIATRLLSESRDAYFFEAK